MGRWGLCLFESDMDLDVRGDIEHAMGLTREDDDEYNPVEELQSEAFRDKLDAGLCDKLFKDFRSQEGTFWFPDRKYYTVLLAAMVMESGAKISDDNMQHLREIVPPMHSTPVYASPLSEGGFFDPGRAQFLAALEYYKPGTPRAFGEASCYHCGKTKADLGKKLYDCARCKEASYCDQDCQKAHWKVHKSACFNDKISSS